MVGIGSSIISPTHNPYERSRVRQAVKNEIRERELEKKWKNDTISKTEVAELISMKLFKFLDSDIFVLHNRTRGNI